MSKYLKQALEVAKKSKCKTKHGCVVVNNGRVLATATNKKIGDPNTHWRRSHIHAEMAAVIAAGTQASGGTVYVARVSADGRPVNSKPCKKCEGIIERYGIVQVFWT